MAFGFSSIISDANKKIAATSDAAARNEEDEAGLGGQVNNQMQDQAQPSPAYDPIRRLRQSGDNAANVLPEAPPNPQTVPGSPTYEPLVLSQEEKAGIAAGPANITPEQDENPWLPRENETQEQATARADKEDDDNYEIANTALQDILAQRAAYEANPEISPEEAAKALWPDGPWYPGRTDIDRYPTDEDYHAFMKLSTEHGGKRFNPSDEDIAALQATVDTYGRGVVEPEAVDDTGVGFDDQPRNRFPVAQYDAAGRSRIPLFDTQNQEGRQAQQQYINMMYQSSLGAGPSAAQDLLSGNREKALRQQQQAGAVGGAGGMRGAQMAMGEIEGTMAREAAMRRSQEQQFAQQLLGQGIEQMRGSDQGAFGLTAGVLDTGATRDLTAQGQLANVLTGGAGRELQAESQSVVAQNLRASLNLSVEQLEHQVIQALNQNELQALKIQMQGLSIRESDTLFTKLVGLGIEGTKAYLSGGASLGA